MVLFVLGVDPLRTKGGPKFYVARQNRPLVPGGATTRDQRLFSPEWWLHSGLKVEVFSPGWSHHPGVKILWSQFVAPSETKDPPIYVLASPLLFLLQHLDVS
jgi:hypothetical protein